MSIKRGIFLFLVFPLLMGMATPPGCSMPPEATVALPITDSYDERLTGFWYLLSEEGGVTETLQIFPREGGDAEIGIVYSSVLAMPAQIVAVATPSEIDGEIFYSVRQDVSVAEGLPAAPFDWTSPEKEPGYIILTARIDAEDRLYLSLMDPDRVAVLSSDGAIDAEHIQLIREDDGSFTPLIGLSEDAGGQVFDYYLIDASAEELTDLIRRQPRGGIVRA
jgi:hypothetical protein